MVKIQCAAVILILSGIMGCQDESVDSSNNEKSNISGSQPATTEVSDQLVEASCGQCQFGMEGNGCDLAVRIDGKTYYVDGSSIDDHGDAHSDDGLCNCIRQAKVTGNIKDGRFVAESFQVLPSSGSKK